MDSNDEEHKLDQLRRLQHEADTARRWHAKRDRTIQMLYVQGTASLSELASAAGISKARAHQIVRGPSVNVGRLWQDPPHRVQLPPKERKGDKARELEEERRDQESVAEKLAEMGIAVKLT